MSRFVNDRCGTKWSGKNAKARYNACLKKFKETKRKYDDRNGAKYCLSEKELLSGMTLDDKLERKIIYNIILEYTTIYYSIL